MWTVPSRIAFFVHLVWPARAHLDNGVVRRRLNYDCTAPVSPARCWAYQTACRIFAVDSEPPEQLIVDSRPATIGIIVESKPGAALRVVVQGFMKARFIPGKHVALDGFYKRPDGTVSIMPEDEFYEFD